MASECSEFSYDKEGFAIKNGKLEIVLSSIGGVAAYPPGATFGPRQMRDWEFVWLLQGDAEYIRGEITSLAPEGSFVLCQPGETDLFRWDRKKRTRHAYVHFQILNAPDNLSLWPVVRESMTDDILKSLFPHLLTCLEEGDTEQAQQTLQLMITVFRTGHRAMGSMSQRAWPHAVELVCAFIFARLEENPAAHLALSQLAEVACVTPEHLCRLFQGSVGHSPVKTVRLARLQHSAMLLGRSNYSVGEIAALTGFINPYHFSRAFKEAYGQSPTEMRRQTQLSGQPPLPLIVGIKSILDK